MQQLFPENLTVYEIMSRIIVETERPQMTSQYGAYALSARRVRMHTPTHLGIHLHARASMHTQANM